MAKVQRMSQFRIIIFWRRRRTLEEVWVGREWKPKLWSRGRRFFFIKKSIIDKILGVRVEGLFWARNKEGCSFGFGLSAWLLEASHYRCPSREAVGVHGQRFGLWAWPLEASHSARPKAPHTIFYWLFSAHFFGLSTKFGHSIPRPLDLDVHSVKQPSDSLDCGQIWTVQSIQFLTVK
jgi:hypothetical protein